jgi:hypothetical protein
MLTKGCIFKAVQIWGHPVSPPEKYNPQAHLQTRKSPWPEMWAGMTLNLAPALRPCEFCRGGTSGY